MTQSDLIVLCHFADGGIWTPYIKRISGVSTPRLSKSSIRIVDTSSADGISTSFASGTSTSPASTVFCFETARVDEHEQRAENSRKEKAYTMRYQPLDNSILIVRLFIVEKLICICYKSTAPRCGCQTNCVAKTLQFTKGVSREKLIFVECLVCDIFEHTFLLNFNTNAMKREILLAGNAVKSRAFLCNQFVLLLHLCRWQTKLSLEI